MPDDSAIAFRLPRLDQRVAIVGRTGSGKTQGGTWLLSRSGFDKQPFIIIDYKGDKLLNDIDRAREIALGEVPKYPGLYIVHPEKGTADADKAMEEYLWRIKNKGNIGLFFDEAYMLPNARGQGAVSAILTQGRSLHLPVIALTQRPKFIQRFIFTEADFLWMYHLQHAEDIDTVTHFTSPALAGPRLPRFHSRWYDVSQDATFRLAPVPPAEEILDVFDRRLTPKRRKF